MPALRSAARARNIAIGSTSAGIGVVLLIAAGVLFFSGDEPPNQRAAAQPPDIAASGSLPTTPEAAPAATTDTPTSSSAQTLPASTPAPAVSTPAETAESGDAESGADGSPTVPTDADSDTPTGRNLAAAIDAWRAGGGKLFGARAVPDEELALMQFSWLVELLPHLELNDVYARFNFEHGWTHETNERWSEYVIPQFLNPLDDRQRWEGYPFHQAGLTHFVGMSGVENRRNVLAAALPRDDPRAGVFGYYDVAREDQITDGLSETIMVLGAGEIVAQWVQGGGATVRGARQPHFDPVGGFGTRGLNPTGTIVLMADGSVRQISADVDSQVFRALCTIHGAEDIDVAAVGPALDEFPTQTGPPIEPPPRAEDDEQASRAGPVLRPRTLYRSLFVPENQR